MSPRKIRILMAKPGLDGHDRGIKIVSRALSEAGFEVIYTGLHQSPETIANVALQENADFVGLSILSGAHNELFPKVVNALKDRGCDSVIVFGGGVIPEDDIPYLKENGVREIFTPGASTDDIIDFIRENAGLSE